MRSLITILLIATFAIAATAAPASEKSIEELLVIAKSEVLTESVITNGEQQIAQAIQLQTQGKSLTTAQKQVLDSLPTKFGTLMRQELNWNDMKLVYIQIYRNSLDQDEVDGLIAFYKTPAGQASIAKMPLVMQQIMVFMQTKMQSFKPKLEAMMNQAFDDAKVSKK